LDSSTQFKRHVDIAWRRKWWIAVPTILAVAVSLGFVWMSPTLYRATTTILLSRQSVPEDMARTTVTLRNQERMKSLQVQLLSRSYLEQIAREFMLVPKGAGEAEVEASCRELSTHITPEVDLKDYAWFKISVEGVDPDRTAGIANRLAELFIAQNSIMRASQAAGTLEVTEGWEDRYREELAKRDEAISQFKQAHVFELPDQQAANLQFLHLAESAAARMTSDIQTRVDRIASLRARPPQRSLDGTPTSDGSRLAVAQHELTELLGMYTEEHPMVRRKKEQIADLVRAAAAPTAPGALSVPKRADETSIQIATIEDEIKTLERDRAQENVDIAMYRARISNAQPVQQKFLELTRDYDQVKHQFDAAVVQTEQAQRSQDLEGSNKGEQFRVQDRAYATPVSSTQTLLYVLWITSAGIGLGVGATVVRELVDQTVRSEDELATLFPDVPIYGVIPSLNVDPSLRVTLAAAGRRRA
jgi:uncharacterized protein involved in exopolysaccharide biosynthesis